MMMLAASLTGLALAAPATRALPPLLEPPLLENSVTVEFQELMDIEYEEGKALPKEVRGLDGKRVTIQGYTDQSTSEGSSEFMLTSDACGCNGTPALNHFVEVTLLEGTTGYRADRLTLTGAFSVGEVKEDGYVVSLFRMEIESLDK
jgi:hypothetical protein